VAKPKREVEAPEVETVKKTPEPRGKVFTLCWKHIVVHVCIILCSLFFAANLLTHVFVLVTCGFFSVYNLSLQTERLLSCLQCIKSKACIVPDETDRITRPDTEDVLTRPTQITVCLFCVSVLKHSTVWTILLTVGY